jgi:Short C-terminal domain
MGLEEFLFPQEQVKYQSLRTIQHDGEDYVLHITNRRIIGHKRKGFIFKKDRVFSVALQEITNLDYKEKGIVSKKGILMIETKIKKEPFEGKAEEVKAVWREMQKYLGLQEAAGAAANESSNCKNQTLPHETDPSRVLAMRLAKGEITKEEYAELKKALEQ